MGFSGDVISPRLHFRVDLNYTRARFEWSTREVRKGCIGVEGHLFSRAGLV